MTKYLALGVFCLLLVTAYFMNKHSQRKFGYMFLSMPPFLFSAVAAVLLYWGVSVMPKHNQESWLYSGILMTVGVAVIGLLVVVNCRRTNVGYGLSISCIQIPVLIALSGLAAAILPVVIFFYVFGGAGKASPIQGKTHRQKENEWYFNRMNPNGFYKKW
ncbi:MAG: hypothetical protein Q8S20_19645 [Sulfuritalea sp.]|nr:hypothetical protein [Sulfuritalea sp.]